MKTKKDAYKFLVSKPKGKRSLGRTRRRWEGNIKINQDWHGDGYWIDLVQDKWRALVNTLRKFRVPQNAGNFLTRCGTVSLQGGLFHGVSQFFHGVSQFVSNVPVTCRTQLTVTKFQTCTSSCRTPQHHVSSKHLKYFRKSKQTDRRTEKPRHYAFTL
jgi:hypothetical protein